MTKRIKFFQIRQPWGRTHRYPIPPRVGRKKYYRIPCNSMKSMSVKSLFSPAIAQMKA